MHFDWVCIFVFEFFCSFPFLFVSLSLSSSFTLSLSIPFCRAVRCSRSCVSLPVWTGGRLLARSLTQHVSLCTRCTLRSLLYLFFASSLACSDFCLCRCCCAAWTSFAVGSIAFRFVSYHFVPPSETNELTHTQACMHACTCACLYDSWDCYTCSHIILLSTSCGFAVVFCGPPIIISPTCQSFLPR